MSAPNVVGLDLSITATGIATSECFHTEGGDAKKGDRRLRMIRGAIEVLANLDEDATGPRADLAVIEALAVGRSGSNGLAAAQVMGVVKVLLMHAGVPYVLVPPASLKKYATGKGNAGKPDMAVALYKRTGLELADDNQVDAAWLRFMGLDALGHPAFELPASHRAALEKVEWPEVPS